MDEQYDYQNNNQINNEMPQIEGQNNKDNNNFNNITPKGRNYEKYTPNDNRQMMPQQENNYNKYRKTPYEENNYIIK